MSLEKENRMKQSQASAHPASQPCFPQYRLLRGYAFDPSLANTPETSQVSEIMYKVPWEPLPQQTSGNGHQPRGPRGEYVEVVDYDPPSGCFYAPADLDHPAVLAQNGLKPCEGNPQFHQQMVYAVAMTTIDRFERALGRKAIWADRWEPGKEDEFIQRLRIYPHAMRQANAFYSRNKGSLLFGYFPAVTDRRSSEFPGGVVFTCLSHDVVAHETTHALLDGFHEHFMEATNADVLAFHEAFADIVALFQHFSFPEQLRHQIARTRGDLTSENLLAQLAAQFGHASGSHGALRDYIGAYDEKQGKWVRREPDPTELDRTTEVHARGAILVAAVFDAFLSIYRTRTRDLLRLATGGTGVLAEGELHPDLVNRLAAEASKAADHVLNICIRALDYCPPVDLTFGEYLRALITADADLMPEDLKGYRVSIVEAFRRRGVYPDDVRTLSTGSLKWSRPEEDPSMPSGQMKEIVASFLEGIRLRGMVDRLRCLRSRREIWQATRDIRRDMHGYISREIAKAKLLQRMTGLALVGGKGVPKFKVHAFREARRLQDDGRILNQVFITILQKEKVMLDDESVSMRCGSTLVIDLDEMTISYAIRKSLGDESRKLRTKKFIGSGQATAALANSFLGDSDEVFAALHQTTV
jgi:hypothetical protein